MFNGQESDIKSLYDLNFCNKVVIRSLIILGAVHHYFESHCRQYVDSQPERLHIKEENTRKTKIRSRQRQVVSYIMKNTSWNTVLSNELKCNRED